MKYTRIIIIALLVLVAGILLKTSFSSDQGEVTNSVVINEGGGTRSTESPVGNLPTDVDLPFGSDTANATTEPENMPLQKKRSTREISLSESIKLPLDGSSPTQNVKHSIPIEEVRKGCFRQDCIPSVDDPTFVSVSEANDILPDDTVGVALEYKGVKRFYPFNMLVTREIVNDVVAGAPLLVTYCPLCGTGIVFDRTVEGEVYEFGVSGMLWQSNLLMYNRAPSIDDRNLWSQVLGEAVVGNKTGTKLSIIPSNILKYTNWREKNPDGGVLNTGRTGDPYGGQYYQVARNFAPDFDEQNSLLDPSAYVFGIEINGEFRAYPKKDLPVGNIVDEVNGLTLTVTKTIDDEISIVTEDGEPVPVISGFWFSWISAHPESSLWQPN